MDISITIGIGTFWATFCIIGTIVSTFLLPPLDNSSGGSFSIPDFGGVFARIFIWGAWGILYLIGVSAYLFWVKP